MHESMEGEDLDLETGWVGGKKGRQRHIHAQLTWELRPIYHSGRLSLQTLWQAWKGENIQMKDSFFRKQQLIISTGLYFI